MGPNGACRGAVGCADPSIRKRFLLAFLIMFWQQFSGTNSIGYYAPEIFETVGVSKTNSSLFATGIYGTVKAITTAIFLIIGIDFFGRKRSLIGGGFWMVGVDMNAVAKQHRLLTCRASLP